MANDSDRSIIMNTRQNAAERGAAGARERPRQPPREDVPTAAAETDSPGEALGALGSALARLSRASWRSLPRLARAAALCNRGGELAARLDECIKTIARPGTAPHTVID